MAWHRGTRVVALWSNESRSNSWAWIDGAWRKYQDSHDDACTNFTILGAHAKAAGRTVDARIEGNIKELYVW
jgi:hypothetical protein